MMSLRNMVGFGISLQVEDSVCISEALLSDLPAFKSFIRFSDDLLEVLRGFEQEQFEDWSRDVLSGLANPKSGIRWVTKSARSKSRRCRCLVQLIDLLSGLQPTGQRPSDGAGPRRRQAEDPVLGPAGQSAAGGQAAGRPGLRHPRQDPTSCQHCGQVLPTSRGAEAGQTETPTLALGLSSCLSSRQLLTVITHQCPAGGAFLQYHRPADDSISEAHDARSGPGLRAGHKGTFLWQK